MFPNHTDRPFFVSEVVSNLGHQLRSLGRIEAAGFVSFRITSCGLQIVSELTCRLQGRPSRRPRVRDGPGVARPMCANARFCVE
jgi:hypothetical protein